jgi:general secretion pathway protein E
MDSSLPSKSIEGFLEFLTASSTATAESVQRIRAALRSTAQAPDVIITELGILKETEVEAAFSKYLGIQVAEEVSVEAFLPLVAQIGIDYAREHGVLPLAVEEHAVLIGTANPFDRSILQATAYFFDMDYTPFLLPRSKLGELCQVAQLQLQAGERTGIDSDTEEGLEDDVTRLQDIALSAPVVNLVNRVALRAFEDNATDIHIEPLTDRVQIRLRKDGLLVLLEYTSKAMLAGISSRIKILAKMNIVERRVPQDGRMRLSIRGSEVDFRVSIVPSAHGETIALRLLHNNGLTLDLAKLGYEEHAREQISSLVENPNGIVIVTGPTGSGKTTTLYALVSQLNRPETKIFTVEDPVEYRIDGITQLQVNPALGLDFARALRSILRQDPDIILVGEIRDRETAQIAIQAALTGHLVLTTLHTNSAAGALTRLTDMGVEPYLIAATVRGVVAQRLVRTFCQVCHGTGGGSEGCRACNGTGYSGRTVAYEIMEMTPSIASMVNAKAPEADLVKQSRIDGMVTLSESGAALVAEGKTSAHEIARSVRLGVEP